MDFNQFTLKAQKAISNAQNMALIAGQQLIENGHLLNAMLDVDKNVICLLYTSPSPRDVEESRMPSSA